MKKYIAIFSVLALAAAVSTAFAGNVLNTTDADDSIFNMSNEVRREFDVRHEAVTNLSSNLNVNLNTGASTIAAADDVDAASIDSGDVNFSGSEIYDTNGLDVEYSSCPCDGGGDDNLVNADDTDDTIVNLQNEQKDEEEIKSETETNAALNTDLGVNTGAHTVAAGGDVGEDQSVDLDSGRIDIAFDRYFTSDLVRILRH